MNVEVVKKEIIQPSHTPPKPVSLELSLADSVMPPVYIQGCLFYENRTKSDDFMSSAALSDALAEVINEYPELTGRLRYTDDKIPVIDTTGDGVMCTYAKCDAHFGELSSKNFAQQDLPDGLLPPILLPDEWLFRVQITRFHENSGVCIAFMIHHQVTDGRGAFTVLQNWGRTASGLDLLPVAHDRLPLKAVSLPGPPFLQYEHQEYALAGEPELARVLYWCWDFSSPTDDSVKRTSNVFQIDDAAVRQLKEELNVSGSSFSANDVLCAVVWKAVARCRSGATGDGDGSQPEETKLGLACDGRSRLDPSLPQGFFGNVNMMICISMARDVLESEPLGTVCGCIRQAINTMTADRIRSALRWISSQRDKSKIIPGFKIGPGLPDFAVTNWSKFPIYEIDFGYGPPVRFRIPVKGFDGLAIVFPAYPGCDDMELCIGLSEGAMKRLLYESAFLSIRKTK